MEDGRGWKGERIEGREGNELVGLLSTKLTMQIYLSLNRSLIKVP